jgi:3-phosphoinositide dependent protein kinase-1
MKILSKHHITREKKMNYVKVERDVMTKLNHPNIVRLLLTFQDPGNLYYVCELAPKGDLQRILSNLYAIDIPQAKLILGQVLLALAHMHQHRILHRDVKPENVLLDARNRVKITDFGTAKMFGPDEPFRCERGSFVGSADYVSPEILKESEVGPSSDLWSFGCLVYALLVGRAPFHCDSNYATFQRIEECRYTLPDFLPLDAKDLISKILVLNPTDRLGDGAYESNYEPIRAHPFFSGLDWTELPRKPIPDLTPYAPAVEARSAECEIEEPNDILQFGEVILRESISTFVPDDDEQRQVRLILSDRPRLFLADLSKKKVKAEIDLTNSLTVEAVDTNAIEIRSDEGKFMLLLDEAEVAPWVEAIQAALRTAEGSS